MPYITLTIPKIIQNEESSDLRSSLVEHHAHDKPSCKLQAIKFSMIMFVDHMSLLLKNKMKITMLLHK
jgi:hypothetical protein